MAKRTVITKAALEAWIAANRPELALYNNDGTKGFYRKDAGPAASFRGIGKTWRNVAEQLGMIEVSD